MTKLSWGNVESQSFEYGLDRGVFYPKGGAGHAWNGLVSIKELAADIDQTLIYIDGVGRQNKLRIGNFAATISAMTYPKAFEPYDGYSGSFSGQRRKEFDFTYRTRHGEDHYQIHLVYNAEVSPSGIDSTTINSDVDLTVFAWDLTTSPESVPNARNSSHFVIDTRFIYSGVLAEPGVLEELEGILYGDESSEPTMPTIKQLLELFDSHAILVITDHGDGTWTAEGPDDVVEMLDSTSFQINYSSAIFLSPDTYTVRTL